MTVRLHEAELSGMERLLTATREAGLDQLQAVLACTFTFDVDYFEQFLESLTALHPSGADHLRRIPVDVVCDHRHYRSHGFGYNVHCWPGENLFHPKLLLLLFSDRLVWLEGSQNMTRAGYVVNRELASFHGTKKGRLPPGLDTLIGALKRQRVDAAEVVWRYTTRARMQSANRSLTSLDKALMSGMLKTARKASDVFVVAPFFDRREHVRSTIESSVLAVLAERYPEAKFWIFLPELIGSDGRHALQASRGTFAKVFGPRAPMRRLVFCGIPSEKRPLHAKLLALRYGRGNATVAVLTGSPNLTEVALLKKGSKANVELARELSVPWRQFERLLNPIQGPFRKIADCRFEPPEFEVLQGWHALESALYDPLRQELVLTWLRPEFEKATSVCYRGKPLRIGPGGRCNTFAVKDGELRLESICRSSPKRRSWCPIAIPLKTRLALGELPDDSDLPPEWWLAQLGSLPATMANRDAIPGTRTKVMSEAGDEFQVGTRVRDLANRMRYAMDVICNSAGNDDARVVAHLGLLEKIFDAHDPSATGESTDKTWRLWVRLELTQMLTQTTRTSQSRGAARLARVFRARLATMTTPDDIAQQWRALTESLK